MVRFRRKESTAEDELQEGQEGWDPDKGTFRGSLRTMAKGAAAFFSMLGIFSQGLLGGFALLNFFMTYFSYTRGNMTEWLQYYSALALTAARIYFALVSMSVIASAARLASDQLRQFEPRRTSLFSVDVLQLICYCIAYLATVMCTPLDDQLTYEQNRNPQFYLLTWNSGFKKQLAAWHAFNVIRTIFSGIGWMLGSYQLSPYVRNGIVKWEVEQELFRRTRPPARLSPVMAMASTPSPDDKPPGTKRPPPQTPTAKPAGHVHFHDLGNGPSFKPKPGTDADRPPIKSNLKRSKLGLVPVARDANSQADTQRDQVGLHATHSASGAAPPPGAGPSQPTGLPPLPTGLPPPTTGLPPPAGVPPPPTGLPPPPVGPSSAGGAKPPTGLRPATAHAGPPSLQAPASHLPAAPSSAGDQAPLQPLGQASYAQQPPVQVTPPGRAPSPSLAQQAAQPADAVDPYIAQQVPAQQVTLARAASPPEAAAPPPTGLPRIPSTGQAASRPSNGGGKDDKQMPWAPK